MTNEELVAKFQVLYEQVGNVASILDANNKLLAQQAAYVGELTKVRKAQEETGASTKKIEGSVTGLVATLDRLHGAWELVQQGMEVARKAAEPLMKVFEAGIQQQNWTKELGALMGSTQAAGKEIAWLSELSKHADFRLPTLVEADQQLQLFGFNARKLLPDIAEAADAMHKPLDDVVQALNLASLGATRGLKRFGIDVAAVQRETGIQIVEGQKLTRDQNRVVIDQIVTDWKTRFGENIVTTEDVMTRIGSAWDRLRLRIANGPIGATVARDFDRLLKKIEELEANGTLDKWAAAASTAMNGLATSIEAVANALGKLGPLLAGIGKRLPSANFMANLPHIWDWSPKEQHDFLKGSAANAMGSPFDFMAAAVRDNVAPRTTTPDESGGGGATDEQAAAQRAWNLLRRQMRDTGRGGVGAAELIKSFQDQSSGTAFGWLKNEGSGSNALDFSSKGGASTVPWLPPVEEIREKATIIQNEIVRLQAQGISATRAAEIAYTKFYTGELTKRAKAQELAVGAILKIEHLANIATLGGRKALGLELRAMIDEFAAAELHARAVVWAKAGAVDILTPGKQALGAAELLGAAGAGIAAGIFTAKAAQLRSQENQATGGLAYGASTAQQPQVSARDQAFLSGGTNMPTNLTINATYIQQGGVQVYGDNGFEAWYQAKMRPLIRQDIEELGAIQVPNQRAA